MDTLLRTKFATYLNCVFNCGNVDLRLWMTVADGYLQCVLSNRSYATFTENKGDVKLQLTN